MTTENWKEEFLKVEKSLIIITQEGVTKTPGGFGIDLNVDTDKLVFFIESLLAAQKRELVEKISKLKKDKPIVPGKNVELWSATERDIYNESYGYINAINSTLPLLQDNETTK